MPEGKKRRYWDACVFIALIAAEEGRVKAVQAISEAAQRGETEIVTSALTLAEVVKDREGSKPLREEDEDRIRAYFEHEFITVVPFTRNLGEEARNLHWKENIEPWDAVHIVCARSAGADLMETYDRKLLGLDDAPIEIVEPQWEGTLSMDLDNS